MPGAGCVCLDSRGSDGKKMLSIAGMLVDMLWGDMDPLVYFSCKSVAPEFSLVCCYGMDDEEGIAIVYLLGADSLQLQYPCFYLLLIFSFQRVRHNFPI